MKRCLAALLILLAVLPVMAGKKLKLNDAEKDFLNKVDLIITLDERKVFSKKLTTHHERARFIELFWAKRDPDLTDNENPFRKEWMARYDYVITHFDDHDFRQTSLNKSEIFMLLGPPTTKSSVIDLALMGPGYRNAYSRFPPELWVYENVGYDYKRSKLKIQFVPTSAFGEFVSITDRLTDHFLRRLKFMFIHHPDLEEAPLNAYATTDYQGDAVELTSNAGGEGGAPVMDPSSDEDEDDFSVPVAAPNPTPEVEERPAPPTIEPADVKEPVTKVVKDEPATAPMAPPPTLEQPKTSDLTVPSTTGDGAAGNAAIQYNPSVGNSVDLRAKTSYFKSGADKRLLLGRVGFPLNNLEFSYLKKQNHYVAPFQLDYHLFGRSGTALHGDSVRTEVALPSKRVLEKRTTWFSKEFAVLLSGDRYTLKAQLTDLTSGKVSYYELDIEVPPLRDEPHATGLVFMDPNVSSEFAKFNIKGKPYNLLLAHDFKRGDRIFPVTELINVASEEDIATIEIQALDADTTQLVRSWDLYTGELTATNHQSFLIHPAINSKSLEAGRYILRVEVELKSGDILLSEATIDLGL